MRKKLYDEREEVVGQEIANKKISDVTALMSLDNLKVLDIEENEITQEVAPEMFKNLEKLRV